MDEFLVVLSICWELFVSIIGHRNEVPSWDRACVKNKYVQTDDIWVHFGVWVEIRKSEFGSKTLELLFHVLIILVFEEIS